MALDSPADSQATKQTARPYRGERFIEWFPRPGGLERAVAFEPGYNDRGGPYGVHGMDIRWMLRGPKGAVQFLMSTGWVPGEKGVPPQISDLYPSGSDLGYHARVPQWEGQEIYGHESCDVLGGRCYYDGSGLAARDLLREFTREGERVIWTALEARYAALTGPGEER